MCKVSFCTNSANRGTSAGLCKVTKFLAVVTLWGSVDELHSGPEVTIEGDMMLNASIGRVGIREMNDERGVCFWRSCG